MNEAFVCEAVRTPIGRYGGTLSAIRADDLAALPIRELVKLSAIDPAAIDEVILGCANQAGEDNRNVARMAALLAGLPSSVPGVTVNRLCASGAEAVGQAMRAIRCGEAEMIVAGGVESMSRAPLVMGKASSPFARDQKVEDTTIGWRFVNPAMHAAHGTASMPQTAEEVATRHRVSREEQDAYALASQQRYAKARDENFHAREIMPVEVTGRKRSVTLAHDEHPRPETDALALSRLKPIVRADGTVTAGNASGVNDGAIAMIIASEAAIVRHHLRPRARLLGMASAGVEPDVMGIGPIAATQRLNARLGLTMADYSVIEINEAFAAQVIASMRGLGVDPFDPRVNAHGGAIALGHPLGMSGARLVQTAINALYTRGGQRALVTMCVGVGQGLSLALERTY
ncbi:3-oxoadipyl-CoA thiolase [Novosphingobium profundi]|uniref:3-oxoadipyl-CoA thiolase n=1 Tax=Novosphingobium profundi TaxID=1774954 RepID=UPI001BD9F24E|nr:3-oxoadipyl-CoA thiolase [Novosphingobium profundi]MBT0670480.1 3-oxoadipyl-CoA thiolase [Novosphingobium profundi]